MKFIKITLKFIICFGFTVFLFVIIDSSGYISAFATVVVDNFVSNEISESENIEIQEYKTVVDSFVKPIFGDRIISSCEYI